MRPLALPSQLTALAEEILTRNLERFGNVLAPKHRIALSLICSTLTRLATEPEFKDRYAADLDCGGGKSEAIIAWIAAVEKLKLPYSVAVCCSRIESLCYMKRALISNGVDAKKIGLWHGLEFDPNYDENVKAGKDKMENFASEPATDEHESKQFLLLSHSRAFQRKRKQVVDAAGVLQSWDEQATWLDVINKYQPVEGSRERDVICWDESLISTEARSVSKQDLEADFNYLATYSMPPVLRYVKACIDALNEELTRQLKDPQSPPLVLTFAPLDAPTYRSYMSTLERQNGRARVMREFLHIAQYQVRVVPVNTGEGAFVTYHIQVPDALKSVLVMDASWIIRELERLDPTINTITSASGADFDGRVKDYSAVELNICKSGSGRDAIAESFRQKQAQDRAVSQEVIHTFKNLVPSGEAMLIVTFKDRDGVKYIEQMKKDMKEEGINTEKLAGKFALEVGKPPVKKPLINFLTWGKENSLSEFKFCANVFFAGIVHRADWDIAGSIVGQMRDLNANVKPVDIGKYRLSEIVHVAYQALCRGACRVIDGIASDGERGRAKPMRAWLFAWERRKLQIGLEKAMPGVVFKTWQPKFIDAIDERTDAVTDRIAEFMALIPSDGMEIKTKEIKKAVRERLKFQLQDKMWKRAMKLFLAERRTPWFRTPGKSDELMRIS